MKNENLKFKKPARNALACEVGGVSPYVLSILVVSVILSVNLGIFDIMTKELKLSGLGRGLK